MADLIKRTLRSYEKNIICSSNKNKVKRKNQSILLLLIIPIIYLSCNKADTPPLSTGDMWDCHLNMTWDSLTTKNALIGEWEWEFITCFWSPEDANEEQYKGLSIEFKSDNTLNVKELGQVTQTSIWKIVELNADLFRITVDSSVPQLHGAILFCDERVLFNNTPVDGCDNYFLRKN